MSKSLVAESIKQLDSVLDQEGIEKVVRGARGVGIVAVKGVVECHFFKTAYLNGDFGDDVTEYFMDRFIATEDGMALRSRNHFTTNPKNRLESISGDKWKNFALRPKPGIFLGSHTDSSYLLDPEESDRINSGESVSSVLSNFNDASRLIQILSQDFFFSTPEMPAIKTKAQLGKVLRLLIDDRL